MAVYPDDAQINAHLFSVTGSSSTGPVTNQSYFNLPGTVRTRGEILFDLDGVTQDPASYSLANSSPNGGYGSITTLTPVSATLVDIKTISIPPVYSITKIYPSTAAVYYNNSSVTVVNGNNYVVNGVITDWALPADFSVTQKSDIIVFVNGVEQTSNSFVYPSGTLAGQGITISPALPSFSILDIRTFAGSTEFQTRLTTMADRRPDRGFTTDREYSVVAFESQSGYEKRRLMSRRPKRTFSLTYTNVSGLEKDAIQRFFNSRSGNFESFSLNLDHLNETGFVRVRFDGPLSVNHVLSGAVNDLTKNFYVISFKLRETYD